MPRCWPLSRMIMMPATRSSMKQKLLVSSPVPWIWNDRGSSRLVFASDCKRTANSGMTLKSHVGTVDSVRPKYQHPVEKLAAEIDCHDFADEFSGGIGITWVQRIGDHERRRLISRNFRGRLINFRARCDDKGGNVSPATGFDNICHAANANVENELGNLVEVSRAVDEGEGVHFIDPIRGAHKRIKIADVAFDDFNVSGEFSQAP